jgi:hypothetical protein
MTPQEKASKQVEVAGWLKSEGYDRRTWQSMAKIIVDYLAEHPVKSVGLADVRKSGCKFCGCESYTKRTQGVLACQRCNEDWQPVS